MIIFSSCSLTELKWKTAFHSLEKDHQLLRADYVQLVGMVGQFLTKCFTKLPARLPSDPVTSNMTVVYHPRAFGLLTMKLMDDFKKQEWIQLPVSLMASRLEQVFQLVENGLSLTWPAHNPVEKKFWSSQVGAEKDDPSVGTDAAVGKLKDTTVEEEEDGRMTCVNDFPNRMKVDREQVAVTQQQQNTRSTHPPSTSKKSIHPETADDAIRQSSLDAKKISFWNDTMKTNDPIALESRLTGHQSAGGIIHPLPLSPQRIVMDTPCPSGSNSRRGSRSSSSSSSSSSACSSKSQSGMGGQCRQSSTSQINLTDGTSILAKVSFVQQATSPTAGQDAIDLQCLVTRHLMSTPADTVHYQ